MIFVLVWVAFRNINAQSPVVTPVDVEVPYISFKSMPVRWSTIGICLRE